MSHTSLLPGDKVHYLSATGRKLRATVMDGLPLRTKGEELLIPVARLQRKKNPLIHSERKRPHKGPKVRWIKRSELRKLPV